MIGAESKCKIVHIHTIDCMFLLYSDVGLWLLSSHPNLIRIYFRLFEELLLHGHRTFISWLPSQMECNKIRALVLGGDKFSWLIHQFAAARPSLLFAFLNLWFLDYTFYDFHCSFDCLQLICHIFHTCRVKVMHRLIPLLVHFRYSVSPKWLRIIQLWTSNFVCGNLDRFHWVMFIYSNSFLSVPCFAVDTCKRCCRFYWSRN